VYASLMVPCWDPEPSARPTFAELGNTALSLGGVASDDSAHGRGSLLQNGVGGSGGASSSGGTVGNDNDKDVDETTQLDNLADASRFPPEFWKSTAGRRLLGVSVHHITHVLHTAAVDATSRPFEIHGVVTTLDSPNDVRVADVVAAFVLPRCKSLTCPRDGNTGCAYVDSLDDAVDAVGPSSALLSYSWKYKCANASFPSAALLSLETQITSKALLCFLLRLKLLLAIVGPCAHHP
jgi:hypothetical protein